MREYAGLVLLWLESLVAALLVPPGNGLVWGGEM